MSFDVNCKKKVLLKYHGVSGIGNFFARKTYFLKKELKIFESFGKLFSSGDRQLCSIIIFAMKPKALSMKPKALKHVCLCYYVFCSEVDISSYK